MRRLTRLLWTALGAGVVTFAAVVISLTAFLNGEGLRLRAEATLTHAIGRPVSIGRLELSLVRGRIIAGDFRVAEDPHFGAEPFVQASTVRIGIEVLPLLLRRELRINGFALERPSVRLLRDAAGTWNYTSLAQTRRQAKVSDRSGRRVPDLVMSSFLVEDGRVLVRLASEPDGELTIRDRWYGPVNLTLKHLDLTQSLPFQLSAGLPEGGMVDATGIAGPWRVGDASATPVTARLRVTHLDLEAAGLVKASSGVSGLFDEIALDLAWREHALHVANLVVRSPRLSIVKAQRPPAVPGAPQKPSVWRELVRHLSVAQAQVSFDQLTAGRESGRTAQYRQVEVHLACWCENTWSPFVAKAVLEHGAIVRANGRYLTPSPLQTTVRPTEFEARVSVSPFDLASSGLLAAGSALGGLVDATGQVQSTAESIHVSGMAHLDRLKLAKSGRPSPKTVLASFSLTQAQHAPGRETTGTIEHAAFSVGGARVDVAGSYRLGERAAIINLRASAKDMPIDAIEAFLPTVGVQLPEGSRLSGGTLSTSLAVSGETANLAIQGPVQLTGTRLMGFDLGSKLTSLSKFTGGRIGSVSSPGTTIRSLRLDLHTGNGQIATDHIIADIASIGVATGAGSIGEGASLHYSLSLKVDELIPGPDGGAGLARDLASRLPGAWAGRAMGAIAYLSKGAMKNGFPILIGGTAHHPTVTPNLGALIPRERPRR